MSKIKTSGVSKTMGKLIDITNQRFGFWVARKLINKTASGQTQWLCECECGAKKPVTLNSLRSGNSTSCGCNHAPNLTNKTFGNLFVLDRQISNDKTAKKYWIARCKCGLLARANTNELINGKITSCGCDAQDVHNETISDNTSSMKSFISLVLQTTIFALLICQRSGKIVSTESALELAKTIMTTITAG
jgi:hypothetical protein